MGRAAGLMGSGKGLWLAGVLALVPVAGFAENKIPDHWRPYDPAPLKMKEGCRMYQVAAGRSLPVDTPGDEWPQELTKERLGMAPKVVAGIHNAEEAKALCELLVHGALVTNAESYAGLLKVHEAEGLKPLVADEELAFDRVAKPAGDGFEVAFTAFHTPQTMGPRSEVTRFEFAVGKDATVKMKTTVYLRGLLLNWQTGPLDTEETQAREAKALARVQKFVEECYAQCGERMPRIPEDVVNGEQ